VIRGSLGHTVVRRGTIHSISVVIRYTPTHLARYNQQKLLAMMISRFARSSARSCNKHLGASAITTTATTTVVRSFSVEQYSESNIKQQFKTRFHLPDPAFTCNYHPLTKIVATIGPTSEQEEPLNRVVKAGMKIMRLNFSHATIEEVELRMKNLALAQVNQCSS
jgi:Pyruvate kinase, barrel domain